MKKYDINPRYGQYFHQKPDENLLIKVLNCFSMNEIQYNYILSKNHVNESSVINNFNNLIPDLSLYYIPRIINSFFYTTPITFNNCITLLRHVLSFFNHFIISKGVVYQNKKITHYTIHNCKDYNDKGILPIKITRGKATLLTF